MPSFGDVASTLTDRYQTAVPKTVRRAMRPGKRDKIHYTIRSNGEVVMNLAPAPQAGDPVISQLLEFWRATWSSTHIAYKRWLLAWSSACSRWSVTSMSISMSRSRQTMNERKRSFTLACSRLDDLCASTVSCTNCFRYHAPSKIIALAWVNDEDTKRADESSNDAYRVVRRMLEDDVDDYSPGDWAQLLAEASTVLGSRSSSDGFGQHVVSCPLALSGSAFYAALVHRQTIYAPHFLPRFGRPNAVVLCSL